MSIWVLITYMLNAEAAVVVPGQDPHIVSQLEFRSRELCDEARQHQAHADEKNGIADQYSYKCVERKASTS
jgi:hypothetical protein